MKKKTQPLKQEPEVAQQHMVEQSESLPVVTKDPISMMIAAKQAGFDMDQINAMMDLQDRNDKRLAKQAWDKAMAEFKRNPPKVIKDRKNDLFGSGYTSIGNMVNTVNAAMGPFGLNARWSFPEPSSPEMIKCTCILAHELGHQEEVTLEGPIDANIGTSRAKNPIQERKSARTYLKLETYEAVTGMASEEGNLDDDGNASGESLDMPVDLIGEDEANAVHAMITDAELDMHVFQNWLFKVKGVNCIEKIPVTMLATVTDKIQKGIKAKKKADK